MQQPHLVVIMADQLRYDLVGGRFTPHINALMGDSQVFNRAWCNSPLCVPSRGSCFTGTYPNTNGSIINPWEPLDRAAGLVREGFDSIYELAEASHDSWHTGKQHVMVEGEPLQQRDNATHWRPLEGRYGEHLQQHGVRNPGGEAFRGIVPEMAAGTHTRAKKYSLPTTGCYPHGLDNFFDGFIRDDSLHAIDHRDPSKPFFLNAMFLAPHPPLEIPEPYFSMYADGVDVPENVGEWSPDQSPLQLYNLTGVSGNRYTREQWEAIWPVYAGLVTLLDDCVGAIVAKLKEQGMYDDSLIVFTADHGEMLGSHRLWQKMCLYEESARVPLSFKMPHQTGAGRTCDDAVSLLDLLPTLIDCCGLKQPQQSMEGRSLAPLLRGETDSLAAAPIFMQFDGNGALGNFSRAVVHDGHKLIVDLFQNEIYLELYDLDADPQEQRNLIFDEAERAKPLAALLRNWMRDTKDHLGPLAEDCVDSFLATRSQYRRAP